MYTRDPYQMGTPMMTAASSRPLSLEDIEDRRRKLEALGLEKSWAGKANEKAGVLAGARDQLKSQATDYVAKQLGLSALTSAADTSAATSALAGAGAGAAGAAGGAGMEALAAL